jgi:hypothetical protein
MRIHLRGRLSAKTTSNGEMTTVGKVPLRLHRFPSTQPKFIGFFLAFLKASMPILDPPFLLAGTFHAQAHCAHGP